MGGRLLERRVDATRYATVTPVLRWLVTEAPAGHRIGVAGVTPGAPAMWAAFGPRLGNRAEFIGTTDDHMLVEYTRERPFLRALARSRYDLVVLYRGVYPNDPFRRAGEFSRTTPADYAIWLAKAGFRQVAFDGTSIVYARARALPEA